LNPAVIPSALRAYAKKPASRNPKKFSKLFLIKVMSLTRDYEIALDGFSLQDLRHSL